MPEINGGRKKNITGNGQSVHKRGEGLGTGPVGGNGGGMPPQASGSHGAGAGRPSSGQSGSNVTRSSGGLLKIVIIAAILLLGGGGGLFGLFGGGSDTGSGSGTGSTGSSISSGSSGSLLSSVAGSLISSGFGSSTMQSVGNVSSNWVTDNNTGKLNKNVDNSARSRYTTIKGNGKDTVTMMVYMCGTDLESKYGMATNDLNEMMNATISSNINIIVYTGGCSKWKTSGISTSANQIYKVESGKMIRLEDNMGNKAMTDPATLTEFIKYANKYYPADRNILIFWDHGGGSLSGYGYDETHKTSGSMNLAGINTALKNAGLKYDFVGFDACLMATVETDLMLANYADYCIASEETEPGVGWYYTNWLTAFSKNTSMSTLEIGKNIIDDFVDVCAQSCPGQKTTLSIVDLAELSETVGDDFKAFAKSTSNLISGKKYEVVSDARSDSREFAQSSAIDQIDLINFALNLDTKEGKNLADTLLSAVKYNRTSSNMTNAYGISIYFPYRKTSKVNSAVSTYDQIGLDDEYSACIKEFAGVQGVGSAAGSSSGSSMESLLGLLGGGSSSGGSQSLDSILGLLSTVSGLTGRSMSDSDLAGYVKDNMLDTSKLNWKSDDQGHKYITLTEKEWSLINGVDLNMFVDDGSGYIDLGLDNLFTIDDYGNLIADTEGTWLSINDQKVAYYHMDTTGDTITGRVPALLNGERVNLIINISYSTGKGSVAGAEPVYSGETETEFRGLVEIKNGDTIDFLCDYYGYDGSFKDSYKLGDQIVVSGALKVSDTYVNEKIVGLYRITDIYGQTYWTEKFNK